MESIMTLAMRNTRLFLRDKSQVFFSFLSMFIIIMLYALFLGDVQVQQVEGMVGHFERVRWIVDSWIIAGIVAVNTVNTTMFSLTVMVTDVDSKIIKDLYTAPVKKWQLALGYIISSWIIGILLSVVSLAVGELYVYMSGGELLSLAANLKLIGVTALSVVSFSSALFFLMSFINSPKTLSTVGSIIGTLIGFIAGIYIPMGALPEGVQMFMKTVPVTYSATMYKQVFMDEPLKQVFATAPKEAVDAYVKIFGIDIYWGDYQVTWPVMISIMAGFGLFFFALSVIRLRYFKKFE